MNTNTTKYKVYKLLDEIESPWIFHGWDLQNKVVQLIPGKNPYPSTLLDYARDYTDATGSVLSCIDKAKSKYKFERIHSFGGAIVN